MPASHCHTCACAQLTLALALDSRDGSARCCLVATAIVATAATTTIVATALATTNTIAATIATATHDAAVTADLPCVREVRCLRWSPPRTLLTPQLH